MINAFVDQEDDQARQQSRIVHALDQEESDSDDMDHKQITDEEEARGTFMMNKTPS